PGDRLRLRTIRRAEPRRGLPNRSETLGGDQPSLTSSKSASTTSSLPPAFPSALAPSVVPPAASSGPDDALLYMASASLCDDWVSFWAAPWRSEAPEDSFSSTFFASATADSTSDLAVGSSDPEFSFKVFSV